MQATGQGGTGGASHAATTYRTMRSRHAGAVLGDINVTPLVDVVLVLLLVFMVTAPMMSRGIDVTLPVADQPKIARDDLRQRQAGRPPAAGGPAPRTPSGHVDEGRLPARRRGPALRQGDRDRR